MSRKLSLILLLVSATAHAECYNRTAISSQHPVKITSIADVKRTVVPLANSQHKCIVNFRAQVNNTWISIEGENTASDATSIDQLCAGAMSYGKNQVLTSVTGNGVNVEQDMVCTDQPIPKIRKVEISEYVNESELQPHPNFPKQFKYQGTVCRWFIEPEGRIGNLIQKQGVACRIQDSNWQVVDKW
jgi:hypothetical protein